MPATSKFSLYTTSSDWIAVYMDGELKWQGHTIDLDHSVLLALAGVSVTDTWIPSEDRDRLFPEAARRPFPMEESTLLETANKAEVTLVSRTQDQILGR